MKNISMPQDKNNAVTQPATTGNKCIFINKNYLFGTRDLTIL